MKSRWFITAVWALAASAFLSTAHAQTAKGWLYWRGPQGDGTSLEKDLPSKWALGGENDLWNIDIKGRGTPVISGDKVYSWGYDGEGFELHEVLLCLDAATGKELWRRKFPDFLSDVVYDRYSIGSPTVDAETGNVYLMTTPGLLICFDPATGKTIWEVNTAEAYGRNTYPNGRTGAPAIEKDLVIIRGVTTNWGSEGPPRDRLYAFDKKDGRLVWSATPCQGPPFLKDSCFASPVFGWWEGQRVFYTGTGSGAVACVNARNGKTLWRQQYITGGINATSVLYKDTLINIHDGENSDAAKTGRMWAIRLPAPDHLAKVEKHPDGVPGIDLKNDLWRNDLAAFTSSPILVGDRIYVTDRTGGLNCLEAATGKILWSKKLGNDQIHASPLFADGKLYVPMNNGSFWILKPGDTDAEVLTQIQLEGNCLGAPAIWNGRVYVHTNKKLYCFGKKDGNDPANLPAPVADTPYPAPGPAASLQIVPTEVLLKPGEKSSFQVWTVDAKGFRVKEAAGVKWDYFVPPTAKVKARLDGAFNDAGELIARPDSKASAGSFKAVAENLSGTIRTRILTPAPFQHDFESYTIAVDHATEGVKFAYPPLDWIGGRFKWEIREYEGAQALAKTTDNKILFRAMSFIGHPDEKNYTMTADLLSEGTRRGMGEVGLVNQRYIIVLKGNHQELEINSNQERLKASVPFKWSAKTWYRMKTRVDTQANGSNTIRVKCWPRDQAEPEAWTLETTHALGHDRGSPGIFGFSPQPQFRVWIDNIQVTPNNR